METNIIKIWHDIWYDKRGRIVIFQIPNIPLTAWLIFTVLSLLFSGNTETVLSYLSSLSLFIWACLELVKGVNYFRKALGLFFVVVSVFYFIHMI